MKNSAVNIVRFSFALDFEKKLKIYTVMCPEEVNALEKKGSH